MKYLLIDIINKEEYQELILINKNERLKVKSFTKFITDLPVVVSGEVKDGVIISPELTKEEIIKYLPPDDKTKQYWKELYEILIEIDDKNIRKIIAKEINDRKEKYIFYPINLKNNIKQSSLICNTIKMSKILINMASVLNLNKDIVLSISLLYYTGCINNKLSLYNPEIREDNSAYILFRIKEKYAKEYNCVKRIAELVEEV